MHFRYLDMNSYKRKSHFEYFSGLAYPYMGATVNVDITSLIARIKAKKLPFFLTFCYCVARAANRVPELRQRIIDGRIAEFSSCKTSHTVALEDGTYCYCSLASDLPFKEFLPYAVEVQECAKTANIAVNATEEENDLIYISTLPWFSYTAIVQPVPIPADSIPRITWGRYFPQGESVLLPVTVLCNHALVDGLHMARFYELLAEQINELSAEL